ncbi:Crp/Fnr family transcriptional regulator [candidate division CSSED10-310 bacterium]|uniref:Crp/Fnr family transcriptional regulator n=1 Tax=candidate division CSSED10-310 bacterium TaxID=2855610 RepID=A0ABV6Z5L2_UNCC1
MLDSERLKGVEIFSFLRPEQVDKISSAAAVIKLKLGECVYEKGAKATHFFIVLKGEIELLYAIKEDMMVPIDELTAGVMFGSCACFDMDAYFLTAKSTTDSEVLKIETKVLRKLFEEDSRVGYVIQKRISEVYFKRYIAAMKNLREVVYNLSSN